MLKNLKKVYNQYIKKSQKGARMRVNSFQTCVFLAIMEETQPFFHHFLPKFLAPSSY
jgi:hypothetical protein